MADTATLKTYAVEQANAYGIPPDLLLNLISQESSWNPNAIGAAGEQGITQLMPGTAPNIDRFDPFASIHFSAQLLKQYFDKFGSWEKALIAYNAGPSKVDSPPASTQSYVSKILSGIGLGSGPSSATNFGDVTSGSSSTAGANVQTSNTLKILFWAAAAIVGIIVLAGVVKT